MEDKLNTIINLFQGSEIRSIWDKEKEDLDVVGALTGSSEPRKYWSVLKTRLKKEGSELTVNNGKQRLMDVLDTEGIFRLIESIPSPNAEPFKLWLAKLGRKEMDNAFDPFKWIFRCFLIRFRCNFLMLSK